MMKCTHPPTHPFFSTFWNCSPLLIRPNNHPNPLTERPVISLLTRIEGNQHRQPTSRIITNPTAMRCNGGANMSLKQAIKAGRSYPECVRLPKVNSYVCFTALRVDTPHPTAYPTNQSPDPQKGTCGQQPSTSSERSHLPSPHLSRPLVLPSLKALAYPSAPS